MPARTANAVWEGSLLQGKGKISNCIPTP